MGLLASHHLHSAAPGETGGRRMVETQSAIGGDGSPAAGPAGPRTLRDRILDATVACIARHGVSHTTIDDIARAAGCGRATVYRAFAGGKDAVVVAAGARELERFLAGLGTR